MSEDSGRGLGKGKSWQYGAKRPPGAGKDSSSDEDSVEDSGAKPQPVDTAAAMPGDLESCMEWIRVRFPQISTYPQVVEAMALSALNGCSQEQLRQLANFGSCTEAIASRRRNEAVKKGREKREEQAVGIVNT